MKTTMTPVLTMGLAALLALGCSVDGSDKPSTSSANPAPPALPAESQLTETPPAVPNDFDDKVATHSEASAQRVPADLERALEANYQASLARSEEDNDVHLFAAASPHEHFDFDALFETIRTTMPPARGALIMQYVNAVNHQVTDVEQRAALLERLGSPALNNVR